MPRENEIEITGPTVLRIGGYRITIELEPVVERAPVRTPALASIGRDVTGREWRVAEEQSQQQSRSPFEPESDTKVERFSFVPRAGGTFRVVGGAPMEIARVVGRDRSLWFVLDPRGRPFAVRRVELQWRALPTDPTPPATGDVIVHTSVESTVADVIGNAEVGGWLVTNNAGVSLHVLRSEAGRWMSLGRAEVRA